MNALERIQRLQEQMDAVKNEAIEELREKRKELQGQMHDVERQIAAFTGDKVPRAAKGARKSSPDAVCKICNIAGHDARAHRSQGKSKKPFTAEELREKGLPAR